jgi:hypothetical protein
VLAIPDSNQLALLSAPALGVISLLELQFADATHRFTTFNRNIQAAGHQWQGLGQILSIGDIVESVETSTQTLSVKLTTGEQSVLALALGNVEAYRGRPALIYLGLLGSNYQLVGDPRLRFSGYMEPVKIDRQSPDVEGGAVDGSIELPLSRAGMARARNADGLRVSHEQHLFEHPGDMFLEYVTGLVKEPVPWLTKKFQEV